MKELAASLSFIDQPMTTRNTCSARRGHGLSDAPPGPYDAATLAEDFRQLVDHLGIQRMSVLGSEVMRGFLLSRPTR
jgi:hypothetical protein